MTRIFRLTPYLMTTAIACLVVLAAWGLIDLLLASEETVVIKVVPLEDDGQIRVQVDGAVHTPGVYLLPRGSTRRDAIQAAGGYSDAALHAADSGETLADGDVVVVAGATEDSATVTGPLDINVADAAQLETLPGIGPVLAARIITHREQNGPFSDPRELAEIQGISERMVVELDGLITVEGS